MRELSSQQPCYSGLSDNRCNTITAKRTIQHPNQQKNAGAEAAARKTAGYQKPGWQSLLQRQALAAGDIIVAGAAGNTNFACDFLSKNYSCTNLLEIKWFSGTMGLFNITQQFFLKTYKK